MICHCHVTVIHTVDAAVGCLDTIYTAAQELELLLAPKFISHVFHVHELLSTYKQCIGCQQRDDLILSFSPEKQQHWQRPLYPKGS